MEYLIYWKTLLKANETCFVYMVSPRNQFAANYWVMRMDSNKARLFEPNLFTYKGEVAMRGRGDKNCSE